MSTPDSLERRIRAALKGIHDAGLRRTLRPPSGVDLSSNDYLGLARHPQVVDAMAEAVRREGAGSTGSRLLRGERDAFSAVERRFAAFKRTERSLYFSSGYLANLAVLSTLTQEGDVIISDELNHASLIDGTRLSKARRVIFPHNDLPALETALAREPGQKFVVVESLFSMDGDFAPLPEYAALCRRYQAALIVDEAHAVGIYGQRGSGLIELAGIERDVLVSINTAGKAIGVSGAFVAGPDLVIEYLLQRARPFIFSTAAPPAVAAAIDASLDVIEQEPQRREKLLWLAAGVRNRLIAAGVRVPPGCSQILSVVIGENERAVKAAEAIQAEGFDVRAIRPPTVPPGTARLRVSVNVNLSEADLQRFVETLCAACS